MGSWVVLLLAVLLSSFSSPSLAQLKEFNVTIPPDSSEFDQFGFSTAISGNLMIVGALMTDFSGDSNYQGSAYLYNCASFPCTLVTKITPSDGKVNDMFGWSVAISGSKVVIGTLDNCAFVYSCNSTSCTYLTKLVAPSNITGFGQSVAISGNRVACWSIDSSSYELVVFVYDCASSTCTLFDMLTIPSLGTTGSLAMDGGILLVAYNEGYYPDEINAAILFNCSGSSCVQGASMNLTNPEYMRYGESVALSGQLVLVQALHRETYSGKIFIYQCPSFSSCTLKQNLSAFDWKQDDGFGESIAVSNSVVAIGSSTAEELLTGAVYLYDCLSFPCTFLTKMISSKADYFYGLGDSVSMLDWKVTAGRYLDIESTTTNGSLTWFDPSSVICNCSSPGSMGTSCNGARQCSCKSGWTGLKCNADIDECALNQDNCDPNAVCTNTPPGSFTCTCKEGYTGNGVSCSQSSGAMRLETGRISGLVLGCVLAVIAFFL